MVLDDDIVELRDGSGLLVAMFSGAAVDVEPPTGSKRTSCFSRNLPYILPSNMRN